MSNLVKAMLIAALIIFVMIIAAVLFGPAGIVSIIGFLALTTVVWLFLEG